MAAGELATVRDGLRAMGDLAASEQFVPYWVANQPCWKTWPAQDLPGLIGLLDPKTDSGKAARSAIATAGARASTS